MKAVDPTIKIGAVLTTPGNWPDGIVGRRRRRHLEPDRAVGRRAVHRLRDPALVPGRRRPAAESLARTAPDRRRRRAARAADRRYAGANAGRIGIALTEIERRRTGMNTQPGALFAADAYSALWSSGVFTVDWWNVHNGIGTVARSPGRPTTATSACSPAANCTADGSVCEPPLNTPFAPYHALAMMHTFAEPGDQLLRAGTGDPLVRGHAVRRANGELAVLLVNQDPDQRTPGRRRLSRVHAVAQRAEGLRRTSTAAPAWCTAARVPPANRRCRRTR